MRFSSSFLLITPLILVLSACSSTTSSTSTTQVKETVITPTPEIIHKDFSNILDGNFRGQLSYKNNKPYFQSCDDPQQYQVITETALNDVYNKIDEDNGEPVYIEFAGQIVFPKSKKSKSSVMVELDRINHMASTKTSLQCAKATDTFSFKAKGNDPYWRINIHDNKLFFATKASNQSYTVTNSTVESTKQQVISAIKSDEQRLSLTMQPGSCYVSDNKEYWGYLAVVESIHGKFSGCGELGQLTSEQPFTGEYLSQSKQSSDQDINLSLNANHTLEYQQGNQATKIVKTGFWKSNTPNTVVAMFTKQDGKKIQQEIIFKRNGLSLSSNDVNKDNVLTKLDETLTFDKMNAKHSSLEGDEIQIKRQFTAQFINPANSIDLEVQKAVRNYFKIHRTDPKNTRFNSVRFDLNGDGKDEAIVLLDWCSSNGCEMLVFESKDKGLVFSSRVSRIQAPILVAQTQHFSWQDLFVAKDNNWLQLDFDGLSYPLKISAAKSIDRPTDSSGVVLFSEGRPTTWFSIK